MGKADALSRRTDHKMGVVNNNDDTIFLKPSLFHISTVFTSKQFHIRALQQGHPLIIPEENNILRKLRKIDTSTIPEDSIVTEGLKNKLDLWTMDQDLITFKSKVYITASGKLQQEVIKVHHDTEIAGHPG
jgi:hypothetical protein